MRLSSSLSKVVPSLLCLPLTARSQPRVMAANSHYRPDGVRIQHDPHAEGMAEKYGAPGTTDADGFDPYADTVGPGVSARPRAPPDRMGAPPARLPGMSARPRAPHIGVGAPHARLLTPPLLRALPAPVPRSTAAT